MRTDNATRAIALVVASALSLTLAGIAPATADTPTPSPTPTETEAPAQTEAPETEAPTESESGEPTSETEDASGGPAEGLVDVVLPDRTIPIPLPLPPLPLPLNLGSLNLSPPAAPTVADPLFGGSASGIYAEAHASDEIRVKTGQLGAIAMRPDGAPASNSAARFYLPMIHLPVLIAIPIVGIDANGIKVRTFGHLITKDQLPRVAFAETEVESFRGEIYAAHVAAEGIRATATVRRLANGQYQFNGGTDFGYLEFYGVVPFDSKPIEPNRTHDIPGLGKVVLNEQKITQVPGDRHGIRVTAIHITLSTAVGAWPVGTDIYIGNAEAIVYE